jgi:hypothetical protein
MKRLLMAAALFAAMSPAMGQSFYKCPSPTPGAPPTIQQMPCSATGGGETVTVTAPKPGDGSITESTARMKALSGDLNKEWDKQAEINKAENDRLQALAAERDKADAQRETAAAIDRQTDVMAAPRVITIRHR